jgi:hypothetical protein
VNRLNQIDKSTLGLEEFLEECNPFRKKTQTEKCARWSTEHTEQFISSTKTLKTM